MDWTDATYLAAVSLGGAAARALAVLSVQVQNAEMLSRLAIELQPQVLRHDGGVVEHVPTCAHVPPQDGQGSVNHSPLTRGQHASQAIGTIDGAISRHGFAGFRAR